MKHQGLTSYHLKLIAIIIMFIDHMGAILFPRVLFLRMIGRIAFPIFAYLIAEGASHSHNRLNYFFRLLSFAFISETFFDIAFHSELNYLINTNVFFTLAFAIATIYIYERLQVLSKEVNYLSGVITIILIFGFKYLIDTRFLSRSSISMLMLGMVIALIVILANLKTKKDEVNHVLCLIPSLLILYLTYVMHTDYGVRGVLMIVLIYLAKGRINKLTMMALGIFMIYGLNVVYDLMKLNSYYLVYDLAFYLFANIALVLIYNYNGLLGKKMKWFFYIFYPLHIAILYFLANIIKA